MGMVSLREVTLNPLFQMISLPNIEDGTALVVKEVDPGCMRQQFDLSLERLPHVMLPFGEVRGGHVLKYALG